MESTLILALTAVLLFCGSAGMTVARLHNRGLRGLGWLGLSLGSGGLGATFFLFHNHLPMLVSVLLADLCILLAFVLLHIGVLELAASPSLLPIFGIALLAFLAGSDLYRLYGGADSRFRVAVIGLLIAGQLSETTFRLFAISRHSSRLPARFTASILAILVAANLLHSAVAIFGSSWCGASVLRVWQFKSIACTIAMLGIAFGFFWTSTTIQASGLEHLAGTDPLTRLFNRRVFLTWCERERIKSLKTGAFFSILLIDLDHFKRINDTFGHHMGDLALCAAVEKIQDAVRGIDVIGRWGGEEFAALLPGANLQAAFIVAERVRRNIEKVSLPVKTRAGVNTTHPTNLTTSIGVSTHESPSDTIHEMLQRADKALYLAKANGRNRIAASS